MRDDDPLVTVVDDRSTGTLDCLRHGRRREVPTGDPFDIHHIDQCRRPVREPSHEVGALVDDPDTIVGLAAGDCPARRDQQNRAYWSF